MTNESNNTTTEFPDTREHASNESFNGTWPDTRVEGWQEASDVAQSTDPETGTYILIGLFLIVCIVFIYLFFFKEWIPYSDDDPFDRGPGGPFDR